MTSELAKVENVITSKVAFTKNLLKNITVKTIHESTKINNGSLCRYVMFSPLYVLLKSFII